MQIELFIYFLIQNDLIFYSFDLVCYADLDQGR